MSTLTVALPKGRLQSEASELFDAAFGVDPGAQLARSRRLAWTADDVGLRFLSVRAADVPTYVAQGAADLGIAGLDVLRETRPDVYEPVDLGIGACRLVLAAPEARAAAARSVRELAGPRPLRVATSYPRIATAWLAEAGVPAEMVRLQGAVEIAPTLGVADAVVDITETGRTLSHNGLLVMADVMAVTARLIVNRVSLKLSPQRMRKIVGAIRRTVRS